MLAVTSGWSAPHQYASRKHVTLPLSVTLNLHWPLAAFTHTPLWPPPLFTTQTHIVRWDGSQIKMRFLKSQESIAELNLAVYSSPQCCLDIARCQVRALRGMKYWDAVTHRDMPSPTSWAPSLNVCQKWQQINLKGLTYQHVTPRGQKRREEYQE